MRKNLKLFYKLFFAIIILLLQHSYSYSQDECCLKNYPKNSIIYLSKDSLKSLYLDPKIKDSEILYGSKNDSKGNYIDARNNIFKLDDNSSSVKVIEELRKSIAKQKRIEIFQSLKNSLKQLFFRKFFKIGY